MHVEHFMTPNPVACEADASCADVAALMRDKGVGCVIVLQSGKVAGIVTDRQLACTVVAHGHDGTRVKAHEVMTPHPATLTLEDNLFTAIDTFRSAGVVRRLPVVNANGQLVGVVSLSDVAVMAKDIVDSLLLEETHHSLTEAHILTGGKRINKAIRNPSKSYAKEPPLQPVTHGTPQ